MHTIIRYIVLTALVITLSACSPDPPRVRVSNQRSQTTDVQLKRSSGNTYNINDVGPSIATGYIEVDPSSYEVDAKIEGVSASATSFFTADEDQSYTVVVINSDPPTVRVDKP
jgi:hypothetical protein